MRVGIDVRLAHWPGIGRYIDETVGHLARDFPATEFVLFDHRRGARTLRGYADPGLRQSLRASNVRFVATAATPFSPTEPWVLARDARRAGVDVMHAPYINVPWIGGATPRLVVTLHDFRHPDLALRAASPRTWAKRAYYELLTRTALARAQRLVCVSHFLAQQLRDWDPGLTPRLEVIHHAASEMFAPMPAGQAAAAVARDWGLRTPYLLFVGTLKPHKNLLPLLQALVDPAVPRELALAVAAEPDPRYPEAAAAVQALRLQSRVRFLGHVAKPALAALYGAAEACVVPSAYESFGLPVIEAMACGTPVIAAPGTALPEVGGDAALYAEPCADALARAIATLRASPDERARRRAAGLRRARCFSWQRSTARLHTLYLQVANMEGRS